MNNTKLLIASLFLDRFGYKPFLMLAGALHVCIGYVELGTGSWIANIMDTVLGGKGLFILLYTSILMFVLRFFAGPIVHRMNPLGLLFSSAVLAVIGLYALGSFAAAAAAAAAGSATAMGSPPGISFSV